MCFGVAAGRAIGPGNMGVTWFQRRIGAQHHAFRLFGQPETITAPAHWIKSGI